MPDAARLYALRCEYAPNPLGIAVARPRLSWKLQADRRGARQTAYQILVATSLDALRADRADLWDSGKVASDQSLHVEYAGTPLGSSQRAWWRVRVWDENDVVSPDSELAWWETGLLARSDWRAEWIGGALVGGPRTSVPAPYLRKTFGVEPTNPIAAARLYVTALGLYEFRINGRKVGEDFLTPGWTDYNKRVQYQVYDVTDLLQPGENALGAVLGDGWYCGNVEWRGRQLYGDRPKLLAQLHLTHADGATTVVVSDGSWTTAYGPVLEADLLMGEAYDARLEMPGWDTPDFDADAHGWRPVQTFAAPGMEIEAEAQTAAETGVKTAMELSAMRGPTVRATQEITPVAPPKEIAKWPLPDYLFDLGQNMVGRVRLKVKGPRGTTVVLRFGEMLKPNGTLYTENLRTALQTDHYTLRGDEAGEVWEPRFTFHGFRYVQVAGYPGKPEPDAITGVVLHSDTPPTGTFACSDPLLNQLQSNIDWGQRGNFVDVPTDCPQRDERLGWTGDAQVFIRTAAFNRDVAAFFNKWQQDLADAQSEAGAYPPIAPNTNVVGADGGPAWADAGIICPWTIYLCYGDTRLLAEHYDGMKRFVQFLVETKPDGPPFPHRRGGWSGFGDWLSINAETPTDLIGVAFLAHSARLLARIADVLQKPEDAARYNGLADEVKQAFANRYLTPAGLLAASTQTACVLALHFDLIPPGSRPQVVQTLVSDIGKRGTRLSTGFVGSPYLAHVLSENGQLATAYALLHQTQWPSWLYAVTQGATTIWERWDGWTEDKGFQDAGMNSFNHYAYGAIGDWLYARVAGIDLDPDRPAYKHVVMRPRPGGKLTSARATLDSMYGPIVSDWKLEDGAFVWNVAIPPNATATVWVPTHDPASVRENGQPVAGASGVDFLREEDGAAVYALASGTYQFTAQLPLPSPS